MSKIKIGILKEGKVPVDHRVPITPAQASSIVSAFSDVNVVCQKKQCTVFRR